MSSHCCELHVSLQLTWRAYCCHGELNRMISWIAHSKLTMWVANSWKAHKVSSSYEFIFSWVSSKWAHCGFQRQSPFFKMIALVDENDRALQHLSFVWSLFGDKQTNKHEHIRRLITFPIFVTVCRPCLKGQWLRVTLGRRRSMKRLNSARNVTTVLYRKRCLWKYQRVKKCNEVY